MIRSGSTTGPIAGTALGSVEKLLHYGIVGVHNPRVSAAMNALSSAATHCKFEASDAASDELVLLRMLQVLQMAITSECGQVLSDEAVCEMMETGLSMCCQMRLSGKWKMYLCVCVYVQGGNAVYYFRNVEKIC